MSIWWWRYEKVRLVTSLGLEECRARLREGAESEWSLFGANPVVASIRDHSFRIRKRRSVKMQTVLYGRLTTDGKETSIECRIGVERLVFALASAWSLLAAGFFIKTLIERQGTEHVVTIILAGSTVTVGAMISRLIWNDDEFLLEFVSRTLSARESSAAIER